MTKNWAVQTVAELEKKLAERDATIAALREALEECLNSGDDAKGSLTWHEAAALGWATLQSPDPGADLLARHAAELEYERELLDGVREQRDSLLLQLNGTRTIHAAELADKEELRARYADLWVKSEKDLAVMRQRAEAAESALTEVKRVTIEDGSFGEVVEALFYGPLREAEEKLRATEALLQKYGEHTSQCQIRLGPFTTLGGFIPCTCGFDDAMQSFSARIMRNADVCSPVVKPEAPNPCEVTPKPENSL